MTSTPRLAGINAELTAESSSSPSDDAWGLDLPRRAEQISHIGARVGKDQLQPGDLVFYNTLRKTVSHVGIYLGDGQFIHAPSRGEEVRVEDMNQPYWTKRFSGARRVSQDDLAVQ